MISGLIKDQMLVMGFVPTTFRTRCADAGIFVSRQTVHDWLSGDRIPGSKNLVAILDILQVPTDARREWLTEAGYGHIVDALPGASQ